MSEADHGQTILEHVADMLMVLSDVGAGDYTGRLKTELPDEHPLAALFAGINEMVTSLESEQQRSSAYRREIEEKLATIEMQRAAIRDLSTPIMEVWQGVLCLPIVGVFDSGRSAEMTEALLAAVARSGVRCAILDITGIQIMDTGTADHFMRMAKAVRLLGADCMLTGVNPRIAETMVQMGVDLSGIATHRTLRDALQAVVARPTRAKAK